MYSSIIRHLYVALLFTTPSHLFSPPFIPLLPTSTPTPPPFSSGHHHSVVYVYEFSFAFLVCSSVAFSFMFHICVKSYRS